MYHSKLIAPQPDECVRIKSLERWGHHVQCFAFWAGKYTGISVGFNHLMLSRKWFGAFLWRSFQRNGCHSPKGTRRCRVVRAARFRV